MLDRTHIMIHHSTTADGFTSSWPAIMRFHLTDPAYRFTDIGYHGGVELLADPRDYGRAAYQGLIGRRLDSIAAACPQGNMNRVALHVCCVGNFDLAPPPAALLECLRDRILLPWMFQFSIPASRIVGHRDFNPAKTCPGRLFDLDALRRMV